MSDMTLPERVWHFLAGVSTEVESRTGCKVGCGEMMQVLLIDQVAALQARAEATGKCETRMLRLQENEHGENILMLGDDLYAALLDEHRQTIEHGQ